MEELDAKLSHLEKLAPDMPRVIRLLLTLSVTQRLF